MAKLNGKIEPTDLTLDLTQIRLIRLPISINI